MLSDLITCAIKIGLSLFLGAIVGLERDQQDKPAGLRDVVLVCLGTTLFAIMGLKFAGPRNLDMLRLFHAPIIGIGFLGSGCIIMNENKVEGMTTAAVLWTAVAQGLAVGVGEYALAVLATVAIYLVLKLKYVKRKIEKCRKKRKKLR